jgi:hypothetical protein
VKESGLVVFFCLLTHFILAPAQKTRYLREGQTAAQKNKSPFDHVSPEPGGVPPSVDAVHRPLCNINRPSFEAEGTRINSHLVTKFPGSERVRSAARSLRHASHQHDLESRPRIGRSPQLHAAPSFLRRRIIRFPPRREADPAPRSCRSAGWEGGNLRRALAEVQRRYLCGEATARRIGRCLNAPAFPASRSQSTQSPTRQRVRSVT